MPARLVKTNSAGMSGCAQAVPIGPGGVSGNITLASLVLPWTFLSGYLDTAIAQTISSNARINVNSVCSSVGIKELPEKS
jgi:hypothetical protein